MAERIIEHPLRTIRLVFDDNQAETPGDTAMLKRYVEIHDAFEALRKQYAKLRFDHMEVADQLRPVQESFKNVEEGMNALIAESEVLVTKLKRGDAILDLLDRMQDFQPVVDDFHNGLLLPLEQEIQALDAPWKAYIDADEKFDELYEAYETEVDGPFYKETAVHALDFNSYFDDMDDLRGHFDKLAKQQDVEEVINSYDDLVHAVNALYGRWADAQEAINRFFAEDNMLDRSLSEACQRGEVPKEQQPLYLIGPDDPMVDRFVANYGLMADPENNKLLISVPPEVVNQGDNSMVQEIVMTLQHFPRMMEKMLFSLDFTFLSEFGGELTEDQWKGIEQPVRWINGFSTLPCIYFFLADYDARHYFLMGDMVFDGKVSPNEDGDEVGLEGEALEELANRVFNTCWFFMLFCHNTGIDPTPHIERMLEEMHLPITIESIREEYEKDIVQGIQLRAQPLKREK